MEKGLIALKGLLGLVLGIAFAILIIAVMFKIIYTVFPSNEQKELEDLVEYKFDNFIKKISQLEENKIDYFDLDIPIYGNYLMFNKGEKEIKVQEIESQEMLEKIKRGLTIDYKTDTRLVKKPIECEKSACICICSDLEVIKDYVFACKKPAKCEKIEKINTFYNEGYHGVSLQKSKSGGAEGDYRFIEGGIFFDVYTQMSSLKEKKKIVIKTGDKPEVLRVYLEKRGQTLGVCLKAPCFE